MTPGARKRKRRPLPPSISDDRVRACDAAPTKKGLRPEADGPVEARGGIKRGLEGSQAASVVCDLGSLAFASPAVYSRPDI